MYSKSFAYEAESGDNCVELPAPSRGTLRKLIVKAISGGSLTHATVYDRLGACSSAEESAADDDNPDDGNALHDPVVHVVVAQTAPSDGAVSLLDLNRPYVNQDEQEIVGVPRRRLWLKAVCSGTSLLHVSYVIEHFGTR